MKDNIFLIFLAVCLAVLFLITGCAPAGTDGATGVNGKPGQGCSVVQLPDGAAINCADGTTAVISNGRDCHDKGHRHETR